MNFKNLLIALGVAAKENIPTILEVVSIVAGGGAVALGCVGQHKADEAISNMSEEDRQDKKKVIGATWKYYVPAAGLYAASVGAGIGSHKAQISKYEAMLSAAALTSDKTEKVVDKAKEALGIETEKDPTTAEDTNRVMFTEQTHWLYEPVSGFSFRAKLSDVYAGVIACAEDFDNKQFTSIGDIIRHCNEIEYNQSLSESAEMFGWFSENDDVSSMTPVFENGYIKPDGTTCIKLEFIKKPRPKYDTVLADF